MANRVNTAPNSPEETVRLELELVRHALEVGDREAAWERLFSVLNRLSTSSRTQHSDAMLPRTTLELSDLAFAMGRGFGDLSMLLQKALDAAERIGDKRSGALIKLHLGRLYYFGEKRHAAVAAFAEGKAEVEALGDQDILTRSAEFLGLYYFVQGMFSDAIGHFETAVQVFESDKSHVVMNPSAPIWLGYCAAYMGEFHRAIGILDYYRRLSVEKGDHSLGVTIRAVLGIVLLLAKKKQEAAYHLSGCLKESIKTKNSLALYFTRGGLAYHHCLEGRLDETRRLLGEAITEGAAAGLVRQYASPMVLEMLFEIHRSGLPLIPGLGFQREVVRILDEPNLHLKGVALRLRAMERADRGEDPRHVMADLEASEKFLTTTGTPVQLAMTRIEMIRLKLGQGEHAAARELAQKAWMTLSGYGEGFFPDDLRHLLQLRNQTCLTPEKREELTTQFIDIIKDLVPTADLESLLSRTVAATNRYFGAERGGIFWFSGRRTTSEPSLRAARNLTQGDVVSESFRPILALIRKAYTENKPCVRSLYKPSLVPGATKAILCVPFDVEGFTRGVLYHDNSYLDGCFDFLNTSQLVKMAQYLSTYIGQIHRYSVRLERGAADITVQLERLNTPEMVYQSSKLQKILSQADQIAASESTVLILGETGVGKELLASRIHRMSRRRENALVILDPTTIPEGLVESELFGHEKGAFTGADRQKKGRMELAHQGTLFIDELGEIPKSIQVKLLRVLQEKTLMRIGGTQTIHSDFRLIAATNRDLSEEVAAGHFREDLYYRLNVVPISLPPLRERREDVPLLAGHFVDRFAAKYDRPELVLTPEDEARLQAYDWPGNVRELRNVIERAVILSTGNHLELDLPTGKRSFSGHPFADLPTLDELQRRYISFVLERTNGRIGGPEGAAQVLGMKRTSLNSRMKQLGIR
jgi:transcriptional regulator with GAF, ATPase, and Fis domain/tetratricopeptide (TPR) repeat protein